MRYTVILQKDEDGGYVATVPVLPGCVSQGDSREEALKNIEEAIEVYLEDVKAAGEALPVEDGRVFVEVIPSVHDQASHRPFRQGTCEKLQPTNRSHAKFSARLKEPFSASIFFCNCKIEYSSASGRGGHPGTYTSMGITWLHPCTIA